MTARRSGRARIARTALAIVAVAAALASVVAAPDPRGLLGAGLALLMGAIALYDARYFIIPNALNAAALALALAHAVALDPGIAAEQIAMALLRGAVAATHCLPAIPGKPGQLDVEPRRGFSQKTREARGALVIFKHRHEYGVQLLSGPN